MRKEDFARPTIPIPHTDCPKCDAPMYLAWPDKFDPDERTFECSECDHSITEVVRYR
jgi:hypothetical protein